MIFNVRSHDRQQGSQSTCNFTVNCPSGSITNVNSMALQRITFPKSIYNINSTNNVLNFNDGVSTKSVVIPPGSYNVSNLATELATLMNAVSSGTYVVSWDPIGLRITISRGANFTLLFAMNVNSPWLQLGFANVNYSTPSTSFTAPNTSQLYLPSTLFICIGPNIPQSGRNTNQASFTYVVPACVNSTNIINYEPMHQQVIELGCYTINQLNIIVTDSAGVQIDNGNADWEMVLVLEQGHKPKLTSEVGKMNYTENCCSGKI